MPGVAGVALPDHRAQHDQAEPRVQEFLGSNQPDGVGFKQSVASCDGGFSSTVSVILLHLVEEAGWTPLPPYVAGWAWSECR
jgi:hypothetical protein